MKGKSIIYGSWYYVRQRKQFLLNYYTTLMGVDYLQKHIETVVDTTLS